MPFEDPVRVIVDEERDLARWPGAHRVSLLELLPDGGAKVGVHLKNDYFIGRISAETLNSRDDWETEIRVEFQRALEKNRLAE